jgi:hypothetical protein
LFVNSSRVSWSSSVLFGEHNELQNLLPYFWHHPVCLQPFGKLDAEKGCAGIEGSYIREGTISQLRKDEGICQYGEGERTYGG